MPFVLTNFPLPFGGSTSVAAAPAGSGAAEAVNITPSAAVKSARLAKASTAKTLQGLGCCCDRATRSKVIGAQRTVTALHRRGALSGLGVPSWLPDLVGIGGLVGQDILQAHVSAPAVPQVTHTITPAGAPASAPASSLLSNADYTPVGTPTITGSGSPTPPPAATPNFLTEDSLISGVPNWALAAAGVGAVILMTKSHHR